MVRRQATTVRVQRRLAWVVKDQMAIAHKLSALTFFTETQILKEAHNRDRERIIGHQDIDLGRAHPGLTKGNRGRLGTSADRNVATVFAVLGRLTGTDNPHWLLAAVARCGRGRDDHSTATVRDHTALEQP